MLVKRRQLSDAFRASCCRAQKADHRPAANSAATQPSIQSPHFANGKDVLVVIISVPFFLQCLWSSNSSRSNKGREASLSRNQAPPFVPRGRHVVPRQNTGAFFCHSNVLAHSNSLISRCFGVVACCHTIASLKSRLQHEEPQRTTAPPVS